MTTTSITDYFSRLTDPRIERTKRHHLIDIISIALCGIICGADSWVDIEEFGKSKEGWLRNFLALPNGIPSHDTFGEVFSRLDADEFQSGFMAWVEQVNTVMQGQLIAIDGKTLCGSGDKYMGKRAIHMVSAWASSNRLILGQIKVDAKSNEITAIPELLQMLDIRGCIVSIDAMGCQTNIAQTIVDGAGHYVLSVKKNQGLLYEDIQDLFAGAVEVTFQDVPHDYAKTVEKDHGRLEIRECWTIDMPEYLAHLRTAAKWPHLNTVVMVKRQRQVALTTTSEIAYYISDLPNQARPILDATRSHWGIENSLHWVLDVAFHEDSSRVRKDNSPQNLAVLRHIALNLLKHETSAKVGIHAKRLKAAWDESFLLKVLAGAFVSLLSFV